MLLFHTWAGSTNYHQNLFRTGILTQIHAEEGGHVRAPQPTVNNRLPSWLFLLLDLMVKIENPSSLMSYLTDMTELINMSICGRWT